MPKKKATATRAAKKPTSEPRKQIGVSMPESLAQALRLAAAELDRTQLDIIEAALRDYLVRTSQHAAIALKDA